MDATLARKRRGGYYTPPALAVFLARWVLAGRPREVLEPSCGDGAFFIALDSSRLDGGACPPQGGASHLPGGASRPHALASVTGFEIEPAEAACAAERGRALRPVRVSVRTGDFLAWHLDAATAATRFDAALGNPPYVRYQSLDRGQQDRARQVFERHGLPFTRHTNAWVPFVAAALARLRPNGRLGMVVPAELLHVLHAQSLRRLLLDSCAEVVVVDPEELWFDGVLQGVVLLLARVAAAGERRGRLAVVPVRGAAVLEGDPDELVRRAEFVDPAAVPCKWMPALLGSRERSLLESVRRTPGVHAFVDLADVDVGIVTGANAFFLVRDEVVAAHGLERWAHPMVGRSEHVAGVIVTAADLAANRRRGLPAHFLWLGDTPRDDFPAPVRRYLAAGERRGLHRRYKCRIRSPWWAVPSVSHAPVGMLKRCHDVPRLALHRTPVLTTDTVYRVRPRTIGGAALVACFVNSLTALTAELEGRHYGGGVLELVPSEIERLAVPVATLPRGALARLDRMVREKRPAAQVLAAQDAWLLRAAGLGATDAETLRGAWARLRARRQRRPAAEEGPLAATAAGELSPAASS